jgi:hypothetical protein
MALPKLEIEISADPTAADVGFKKIERSLDGLEKATRDYQVALNKINAAEKAGVITSKAAAAAVLGAEQAYESAARAAAQYSGAQVNLRRETVQSASALTALRNNAQGGAGGFQNFGYQIQDFAVQVGAGTSATQALGQQLPQLLSGFGTLGVAMGAVAAIGIPLGAALLSVGDEAKTLEDALTDLEAITNSLDSAMSILDMSLVELSDKYGEAAARVREYAEIEAQIAVSQAREALREQIGLIGDVAIAYTGVTDRVRDTRNALNRIERDFGLVGEQAKLFQEALRDVASGSLDEQRQGLLAIRDILEANNMTVADLPPELAKAVAETIQLSNAMDQAAAFANDVDDAANRSVTSIGDAADEAGRLARNLLEAQQNRARRIAGGPDAARFEVMDEYGGSGIISVTRTGPGDKPASRGGRSRSGGGRAQQPDRIGALAQSLMTESEMLENWRSESMTKLEEFNQLELEALGGHAEAKLRLEEEYQDRLRSIQDAERKQRIDAVSGALGDVATLMQSENKKIFAIGKAASIANATIKGYEAAVEAWDKGMKIGGPPVAAAFTAASLAKTGALISNIASQQVGGGSSGAPSGGSASSASAAPAVPTQTVSINLQGDTFSRGSVEGLLEQIQSQLDRGGRLVFS